MAIELECKIRVPSHAEVRRALETASAQRLRRVLETNRLFDRPDNALERSGRGLRIRTVEMLDGGSERPATLTFKGPVQSAQFKQREEIEVTVNDAAAMQRLLESLGFVAQIIFEKRRESWRLDECEIELDEVPGLGLFVEVEGLGEREISGVLRRLGLARHEQIKKSYVGMVAEGMPAGAPLPWKVTFVK